MAPKNQILCGRQQHVPYATLKKSVLVAEYTQRETPNRCAQRWLQSAAETKKSSFSSTSKVKDANTSGPGSHHKLYQPFLTRRRPRSRQQCGPTDKKSAEPGGRGVMFVPLHGRAFRFYGLPLHRETLPGLMRWGSDLGEKKRCRAPVTPEGSADDSNDRGRILICRARSCGLLFSNVPAEPQKKT